MSNYVYNRIICTKDFFEKYFLDFEPFGKNNVPDSPYITFHKLFGAATYYDYDSKYSARVYNGYGFHWEEIHDKQIEVKFCTRWEYPVEVIIKALELGQGQIEWFSCEENHVYVSCFCWTSEGVVEHVLVLDDNYWDWIDENEAHLEKIIGDRDFDDEVWYYLPLCKYAWKTWPSCDIYSRYAGKAAVHVGTLDWSELKDVQEYDSYCP